MTKLDSLLDRLLGAPGPRGLEIPHPAAAREGLEILAGAFGPLTVGASMACAGLLGADLPAAATAVHWHAVALVCTALWLLIRLREVGTGVSWVLQRLAGLGLCSTGLALLQAPPGGADIVVVSGWMIAVVWAACCWAAHHGASLRTLGIAPTWAKGAQCYRQAGTVVLIAMVGMAVSSQTMALVMWGLDLAGIEPGISRSEELEPLPLLVRNLASPIEELAVVAVLVNALEAARRPAWQIYGISAAVRVSYHVYYGPAAVAIAITSVVQVWLYRRTRRLTPLIVAHLTANASVNYGQPVLIALGAAALPGPFIAAAIERRAANAPGREHRDG